VAYDSTNCGPGNSSNPADSVGVTHNLFLDTLIVIKPDTSLTDMITTCQVYSSVHHITWNQNTYNYISGQNLNIFTNLCGSGRLNFINHTITNLNLSSLATTYLTTLFDSTIDSAHYNPHNTYCDLKNNLVAFESVISNDSRLSTSDRTLLLGACSVARYSSYNLLYINCYNTPTNNYTPYFLGINPVMWADVIGWCTGYSQTGSTAVGDIYSANYSYNAALHWAISNYNFWN
jgi:hypothetical protein